MESNKQRHNTPAFRPVVSACRFEKATVLLSMPEGKPDVAKPKDFDWNAVLADVDHVLQKNGTSEHAQIMAEWRQFVDARPKNHEDCKSCGSLPKWDFKTVPAAAAGGDTSAGGVARRAVQQAAISFRQPNTITSSVGDGAEARAARRARNVANEGLGAALLPLEPNTWAMVAVEYADENEGGCQIPRVLVQLPSSFDGIDTTRPDAQFDVKWWEPKPPRGTYDREWRKWMNGQRQHVSSITRGMVALTNVKFTRLEELSGGYRKLNAETKRRLASDAGSKYDEFS